METFKIKTLTNKVTNQELVTGENISSFFVSYEDLIDMYINKFPYVGKHIGYIVNESGIEIKCDF